MEMIISFFTINRVTLEQKGNLKHDINMLFFPKGVQTFAPPSTSACEMNHPAGILLIYAPPNPYSKRPSVCKSI